MEGKITINSDEVKAMVSDWTKSKLFIPDKEIRIESINAKSYGLLEIEVYFSNKPLEEDVIPEEETE